MEDVDKITLQILRHAGWYGPSSIPLFLVCVVKASVTTLGCNPLRFLMLILSHLAPELASVANFDDQIFYHVTSHCLNVAKPELKLEEVMHFRLHGAFLALVCRLM